MTKYFIYSLKYNEDNNNIFIDIEILRNNFLIKHQRRKKLSIIRNSN